jgi:alanyl-tRNA synthetase
MLSSEIRQSFLDYYTQRGHTFLPSASLVPVADASLLLINSGMAPLKRYFLGQETPPAPRTCNCQKCVRTIDIDQVGHTNRHNTFFEMLGKWSFGDYFKLQAMRYSIEWMTGKEWLGMDPARLYVTHHERDEESRKLWLNEMGWPESRLFALGDKDNLWAAGDTGPWGYDTEYFWDFAPDGLPMDTARFEALCDSGRIVEIGNDVFMEFNRDEHGVVTELPMKNVDYGGGLERYSMVMQNVRTVYQTDCMDYLIRGFAEVLATAGLHTPTDAELFELGKHGFNPYWLAADHIRTATLLLGDGVTPGNVGRNYVLRRLIRRIIAQAYRLGVRAPFIMRLADLVIDRLGSHYIELKQSRESMIAPWIEKEEQQFFKVMETGYGRLADKLEQCLESRQPVPGEFLFELYDTYGFPFDIGKEMCEEQGVEVLEEGYQREMAAQKTRARGAAKFEGDMGEQETHSGEVQFVGYDELYATAEVIAVEPLDDIRKQAPLIAVGGEQAAAPGLRVTTNRTPFYAASGGQPDDRGVLRHGGVEYPCQATPVKGVHLVLGQPALSVGDAVELEVDAERRNALRRPHTTNHLMLKAMKLVLGEHVSQAGSQLDEDEIRFDFSHFQACASEELRRIETIVNRWLLEDHPVRWDEMPLIDAKRMGVTAVFDEKYGATVRVVSVGRGELGSLDGWVSRELCGGTHMDHTSQAGLFLIVKEESVQSGIRRVYGLTGYKAAAYVSAARQAVDALGDHYKRPLPHPAGWEGEEQYLAQAGEWRAEVFGKLLDTEQKYREAQQAAVEARRELALSGMLEPLKTRVVEHGGLHVLCAAVELAERGDVKFLVERFAGGLWPDNYIVFVAANVDGKAALCCKVSPEAVARGVIASELIAIGAKLCGGGGGGRPEFAEAGGKDGGKCADAAAAVQAGITERL